MAATFSQSEFQAKLVETLVRFSRGRVRHAAKLHCGKAKRQLVRIGYTLSMADTIVEEARDMANLTRECECGS